jgi:hypothetical protein
MDISAYDVSGEYINRDASVRVAERSCTLAERCTSTTLDDYGTK